MTKLPICKVEEAIKRYGEVNPDLVFANVVSMQDLITANVAFLENRIVRTPYHFARLAEESNSIRPHLIEINKLGFISVASQPPFISKDSEYQQRSFISGYLPKRMLETFIVYMHTHKTAVMQTEEEKSVRFYYTISITNCSPPQLLISDYPDHRLNVSRRKSRLVDQEWDDETNLWADGVIPDQWLAHRRFPSIIELLRDCVHVDIVSAEYGQGCAIHFLLRYLQQESK